MIAALVQQFTEINWPGVEEYLSRILDAQIGPHHVCAGISQEKGQNFPGFDNPGK
jgi:hypothetical protein